MPPGAPIVKIAPSRKLVTASFDVDTLRSLCEKYAVETARVNADIWSYDFVHIM
ncbi:hypothetical protein B0H11DRAFT_2248156 [Mycena galericulata]|nr:hypothetical protein B0H11DRAFT_2248156 [Mycena galericulata]